MSENPINRVDTLTFDIFGTVLDLTGGIVPTLDGFLAQKRTAVTGADFWTQWRARQRIEQYQDTIVMLGHDGYLEVARRALVYTLRKNEVEHTGDDAHDILKVFENLNPFQDAVDGLNQLASRYRLVALSNGNQWLVDHLVDKRINAPFSATFSVDSVGRFKPHPSVYRTAAKTLDREPGRIMMVAAHAFDVMGARACGFRGAYVNRYRLPYEDSVLQPDATVNDFRELASWLLG
jgi:2-haloacid dehalogenase